LIWLLNMRWYSYFLFLGLFLNRHPQQGQKNPCQLIKIWQPWQRFCPIKYLLPLLGLIALWREHIPLHTIYLSIYYKFNKILGSNIICYFYLLSYQFFTFFWARLNSIKEKNCFFNFCYWNGKIKNN
jgi:hypothetical protein